MNKPVCVFVSPIFTRSGYGGWALEVAKSLQRYDKYDLKLVPTAWGACSKSNMSGADEEEKLLLTKLLTGPLNKQPEVFIQMTIPIEYQSPAKYNIGITAGIESTRPRAEWLSNMNKMNLNIALSDFAKDVLCSAVYKKSNQNGLEEELKVNTPCESLFWGVNTNVFYKTDEKVETVEAEMSKIPEQFAFLFVGQWTSDNPNADRKNVAKLIETFLKSFVNVKNPPCLILKTNGAAICQMDKYACINRLNDIVNSVKQHYIGSALPNVYILHGELTDKEMNALYNHEKVKVNVSFTHGEGQGNPLLQASMTGKPVVAPNWSGHLGFLNKEYCQFFDGKLVEIPAEARNEWFVEGAKWFEVDYDRAKLKLRELFYNYNEKLLSNYEKLRLENVEKFSIKSMDVKFHAILDKYVPQFATEHSIILPKLKRLNLPKLSESK